MKSSKPDFAAAAAPNPLSQLWSAVHKLCVLSMLFMAFGGATTLLGATKAFAAHIGHGLLAAPDAITNIAHMITPPDGGASFFSAPTGGEHLGISHATTSGAAMTPLPGAENACAGPFNSRSEWFACQPADFQAGVRESASALRIPVETMTASYCGMHGVPKNW